MITDIAQDLPNESLRWRVAGTPDGDWFRKSGAISMANIDTMLSIIGTSYQDYRRALEFGCGCGRILLHMQGIAEKTELYGVDIDSEAIGWAQSNVPWVRCSVNDGMPPLNFPDGHFDLVFNQSVFTHLNETYQDAWLAELARVTRPGAALVLSVCGDHAFDELLQSHRKVGADPSKLVEQYQTKGIVYVEDDGWTGGPFPDFYHSAFHAPWYVFQHWSKYFEIKAYVPRGSLDFQDYLLLQRREHAAVLPQAQLLQNPAAAMVAPAATAQFARRIWRGMKRRVLGA